MGEAVLAGLLRAGQDPDEITVVEPNPERADEIGARHGVTARSASEAATWGEIHLLIVKPHQVPDLLDEIGDSLGADDIVASLAAGVPTATIEGRLPAGIAVVRVMPNTPALVGQGMAALSAGAAATDEQVERVAEVLRTGGSAVIVPESQQDVVTGLSGSGPAYVFYIAEALIEAGVVLGLPRTSASELATQTLLGAATMLRESGEHPSILRERVTSPGGTTAAGLRTLDEHAVRAAVMAAVEAAAERSAELGRG